jgi:hypothetical protein
MFLYVNNEFDILPKWKKDAKEFTVSVNYNETRGYQSSIPKPIIEALGDPKSITFTINGNTVKIISDKPKPKVKL